MEDIFVQLLTNSQCPLTTIRGIVTRSQMRRVEKPAYTVWLINLARKHNLLKGGE